MQKDINIILDKIRQQRPVILNITNDVTMDIVANGLLSLGASPVMSKFKREIADLIMIAKTVVINLGTLDDHFISLCHHTCEVANQLDKPIILDPVGAGASECRTLESQHLIKKFNISIIRGNASEIIALSGESSITHGVDSSSDSLSAIKHAQALARKYTSCVFISGKTDIIVSNQQTSQINRGSSIMPLITGTGCLLSAVVAAFHAAEENAFQAANAAALFYSICGEKAEKISKGPGSFKSIFIDMLYENI